MGKWKAIGIVFVFALIFILLQTYVHWKMGNWESIVQISYSQWRSDQAIKQFHSKSQGAIADFLSICKELRIEAVLIDKKILKHLTERAAQYSKGGKSIGDEHRQCHYFCNQEAFTFGVFSPVFQESGQWDTFSKKLEMKNFKSELLQSPDERQITIEDFTRKSIVSHALCYNGNTIINLVIFHTRDERHWSSTCVSKKNNRVVKFHLKDDQFCKHQNMLKKFTVFSTTMDDLMVTIPFYPVVFLRNLEQSSFIPCDLKRARRFFSVYGLDKSENAEIFRLKAKNLLTSVKAQLDQLGIPFWLSSGTCLGWFRQCDFVPHSKDVDLGIFIKDYNPSITKYLERVGLVPKHIFGKVKDSFELSFRTPSNDLKLDIFFFYEESDHMWNGGTQAKTGNKYKYRFPKFALCWTEFVGMVVRVPCNTLEYVKANYGPGWNQLIKDWDWKKSPSNVEDNGRWSTEEQPKVVQVFD